MSVPEPTRLNGDSPDLLRLVFARPEEATQRAQDVLAGAPSPYDASVAYQVLGLVQREFGDLASAITYLRRAFAMAHRSGSVERESDARAALGIALVHNGQSRTGLEILGLAVDQSTGVPAARVRFRRGGALWVLGRHEEALADLRAAVPVLRRANDTIWTARALTLRGLIELGLGSVERADADFAVAERLFASTDQDHDSAVALHNRGLVAFRAGDLPAALARFDEVDRRYRMLGTPMPELAAHRCAVLLAAGLPHEALAEADAAIEEMVRRHGQVTRRAELLLVAGHAALAAREADTALERAREAAMLFTAQQRAWWRQHALLLVLRARFAIDPSSARLLAQATETARQLEALGAPDAIQAHMLAGRIAMVQHRDSTDHLLAAARARRRGPAMSRVDGWLALALLAASRGDTRRMFAASRRGLDVLDEHRRALGAPELRARATALGAELAELAQRACLHGGPARRLLLWSERWRATVCTVPEARPSVDPAVRRDLVALRDITSRIDQARADGMRIPALAAQAQRLERRIRDQTRRLPGGTAGNTGARLDLGALLDELGADRLLEIVAIDGDLHVLNCGAGQVRRTQAGRLADAAAQLQAARWALRRLAYEPDTGRGLPRLRRLGQQLQDTLLGVAARHLGDGLVVIVPPGWLHAVPWALLPCLTERVHGVAPSAMAWLNARHAPRPTQDRVVLVGGPELGSRGAELSTLAELYDTPQVLRDGSATTSRVLSALDGSSLAHIAAHGTFRADSPLFSSISLDDGPLTVYDFDGLRRAPFRVVLSSCDSGSLQPVGADELLGLATALLPLGTAGIVASLVPVNDVATVPLMRCLHVALQAGATMAESLAHARSAVGREPVQQATAWSFVALGGA